MALSPLFTMDRMADTDPLVIFTPSGKRGRFARGTPVLQAARSLGVDLDSVCGGRGICSKCQVSPGTGSFPKHGVTVSADALSPWNAVEERYKSKRGLIDGRRLGCQAQIESDVVIDVPATSQVHQQVVRKEAADVDIALDPVTRFYQVAVEEPDMHNPKGDFERLRDALAPHGISRVEASLPILASLQAVLREGDWTVTVALQQPDTDAPARILQIWPGAHDGTLYGVAFDVGSTTIACHLCDLKTGAVIASGGQMNPQIRFGEDLMSRVSYSMMNPGGHVEMTAAVRLAINELIVDVAGQAGITVEDVAEAVLVGNPVMHHLLLGIDPKELGWAPFALATSDALTLRPMELDLAMHAEGSVYILPCIAGHVGADAAAVALAEAPQDQEAMTLVVDVGTNAEILLGNKGKVLACSSPTGPAFEGAQISSGQRAAPGAIERVRIDPVTREPRFRVIGCEAWSDAPDFDFDVTGICGSGIIEAIAEMRIAGIIDTDGSIGSHDALATDRIIEDGRTWAYVLHRAEGKDPITVTQGDVRAIQLAKAALHAGAQLLMDKIGIDTVERVVLAGAFGAHISPLHALVLGMIPDCAVDQVTSAGNAAGTGARMALLNRGSRRTIEQVVRRVEKIETAVEEKFQEHFVSAIAVPHKTQPYPKLAEQVTLPSTPLATTEDGGGRRRRRRRP